MGKRKRRKRIEKILRDGDGIVIDDIVLAGVGTLAKAAKKDRQKTFTKAVERGHRAIELDVEALNSLVFPVGESRRASEPVISYSPHGGGWFRIEINGTVVERVKGEEASAARAGELLESYAALSGKTNPEKTGVIPTGGGWYEIVVSGVPVDKVQGRDLADQRLAEIEGLNRTG